MDGGPSAGRASAAKAGSPRFSPTKLLAAGHRSGRNLSSSGQKLGNFTIGGKRVRHGIALSH
jgi:hypothetical protein